MSPRTEAIRITNRLRVMRAEKNVTQEQLANAVGVTRVTINCVENCVYLPSLELAVRIARYFGRTVDETFPCEGGK